MGRGVVELSWCDGNRGAQGGLASSFLGLVSLSLTLVLFLSDNILSLWDTAQKATCQGTVKQLCPCCYCCL